jgi:hypothetical protein
MCHFNPKASIKTAWASSFCNFSFASSANAASAKKKHNTAACMRGCEDSQRCNVRSDPIDSYILRCRAHRVAGEATPLMSSHSASTTWNTSPGSHW